MFDDTKRIYFKGLGFTHDQTMSLLTLGCSNEDIAELIRLRFTPEEVVDQKRQHRTNLEIFEVFEDEMPLRKKGFTGEEIHGLRRHGCTDLEIIELRKAFTTEEIISFKELRITNKNIFDSRAQGLIAEQIITKFQPSREIVSVSSDIASPATTTESVSPSESQKFDSYKNRVAQTGSCFKLDREKVSSKTPNFSNVKALALGRQGTSAGYNNAFIN